MSAAARRDQFQIHPAMSKESWDRPRNYLSKHKSAELAYVLEYAHMIPLNNFMAAASKIGAFLFSSALVKSALYFSGSALSFKIDGIER